MVLSNEILQNKKTKRMIELQNKLFKMNINEQNNKMNIDNEYNDEDIIGLNSSEEDIPKFNEKKRKRKNLKKQNIELKKSKICKR